MATSQQTSHEDSQNSDLLPPRELQFPYHRDWETENKEVTSHIDSALRYAQRYVLGCVDREYSCQLALSPFRDREDCIGNECPTIKEREQSHADVDAVPHPDVGPEDLKV